MNEFKEGEVHIEKSDTTVTKPKTGNYHFI